LLKAPSSLEHFQRGDLLKQTNKQANKKNPQTPQKTKQTNKKEKTTKKP